MCYSSGYKSSHGNQDFYQIGLMSQMAACNTSQGLIGGRRKRRTKRRTKRRKTKRKNIRLY